MGKNGADEAVREAEAEQLETVRRTLRNADASRCNLIPLLQQVQETMKYLHPEALGLVAAHLDIPVSEVYGVATFYNQFRFNPPGKYPIKVCLGTACHVRGGEIILENFERKLDIKEGETTLDREFSLERVACVGCCALAPVILVGETVHGQMAPSKVESLFSRIEIEKEIAARQRKTDEN